LDKILRLPITDYRLIIDPALDYEKYRNTLKTDYLHFLNVETFSCKDEDSEWIVEV